MTKTIPLNDVVHKYLKKVQSILYHEYNIEMRLQDILAYIVDDKNVGDAGKVARMISKNNLGYLEYDDKDIDNDITEIENKDATVVPMGD